ncbi:MAG: peptidylprolyl isomerase [Planctomycetota bacterium]
MARVKGIELTKQQYFTFLGRTAFKRKEGDRTLAQIIDETIVRLEARKREIEVTQEQIDRRVDTFRERVAERSNGEESFDAYLAKEGISLADLESLLQLVIAQEELVRQHLSLSIGDEIPAREMNLWLTAMRKDKEYEPKTLASPEGDARDIIAWVADTPITFEMLGAKLYQVLEGAEKSGRLRELANLTLLFQLGLENGVEVTEEDLDQEVTKRRELLAGNEQLAGISYEEFLSAQGLTLDDVRNSRRVRAGILLDKIIDETYPPDQLETVYQQRKEELDRTYGLKRRASMILLQAGAYPNALRKRSLEEARLELEAMRERIRQGTRFDYLARTYSEHATKERGGDLGLFTIEDPNIPKALRDAAFRLAKDEVSAPIQLPQGYALVMVTDIEDNPTFESLREAVRNHLKREWFAEQVQSARIEFAF